MKYKVIFAIGTLLILSLIGVDRLYMWQYRYLLTEHPDYDLILLTNISDKVELLGRSYDEFCEFYRWSYGKSVVKSYCGSDLVDKSYWRVYHGAHLIRYKTSYPTQLSYTKEKAWVTMTSDYYNDSLHRKYVGRLVRTVEIYPDTNKESIRWYPADNSTKFNLRFIHETDFYNQRKSLRNYTKLDLQKLQISWEDASDKFSTGYMYNNGKVVLTFKSSKGYQEIDPTIKVGYYIIDYEQVDEVEGIRYTPSCLSECHVPFRFRINRNYTPYKNIPVFIQKMIGKDEWKELRVDILKEVEKEVPNYVDVERWKIINRTIIDNVTGEEKIEEYNYTWTERVENRTKVIREKVWMPFRKGVRIESGEWYYADLVGIRKPKLGFVASDVTAKLAGRTLYRMAWWNSSWSYRKPITITENSGNTLTDYQVPINITYDADMVSDFSDLRFTWYNSTDATETEIPYWIESKVDSSWAYVWVKVPSITASGTETVYVYYGNTTVVSSESNGNDTFDIFDDFDGTTLDTNKWNEIDSSNCGTPRVEDSYLHIDVLSSIQNQFYISSKIKVSKPSWGGLRIYVNGLKLGEETSNIWTVASISFTDTQGTGAGGSEALGFMKRPNDAHWSELTATSGTWYESSSWVETSNFPSNYIIEFLNNNNLYRNNSNIATVTQVPSSTDYYIEIQQQCYNIGTDKTYLDTIWVTKYTSPEPTYSIGAEETANQPPSNLYLNGLEIDRKYEYNTKANITVVGTTGSTYCIGTDAYGEENISCGASPFEYNYTVAPYWEKNFSFNGESPIQYNETDKNFTNGQYLTLSLMRGRNLTNAKINVTGYSVVDWFVDALNDGIPDVVGIGNLSGNLLTVDKFSNGLSSESMVFTSQSSKIRYINTSVFDFDSSTMHNFTLKIWGKPANPEYYSFEDGFGSSEYISSGNATYPFRVYDDFSMGEVSGRWDSSYSNWNSYEVDSVNRWIQMSGSKSMVNDYCDNSGVSSNSGNGKFWFKDINMIDNQQWKVKLYLYVSAGASGVSCTGYGSATAHAGIYDITTGSYTQMTPTYSVWCAAAYGNSCGRSDSDTSIWTFNLTGNTMKSYDDGVYYASTTINPSHKYAIAVYTAATGQIDDNTNTGNNCYCSGGGSATGRIYEINTSGVNPVYTGAMNNFTNAEIVSTVLHEFGGQVVSAYFNASYYTPDETKANITWYLSPNGVDWEEVIPDTTHTFTNYGTNISWKASMITDGTELYIDSVKIIVSNGTSSNVSIDICNDGTYEYVNTTAVSPENSPFDVSIPSSSILNCITSIGCNDDTTCLVPVKFVAGSQGRMNYTDVNLSITLRDIDLTRTNRSLINDYLANNDLINISFGMSSGTLEVKDLAFTYPKDYNLTVTAFPIGDKTLNITKTIMVRYSKFNLTYPTSFTEVGGWDIRTNNDTNVPPYGQSDTTPIWNITADSTITDPFKIGIKLNEEPDSCINLKVNNISYPGNATNLTTSFSFVVSNVQPSQSVGIWWWLDLNNCPYGLYIPNYTLRTYCNECVVYE